MKFAGKEIISFYDKFLCSTSTSGISSYIFSIFPDLNRIIRGFLDTRILSRSPIIRICYYEFFQLSKIIKLNVKLDGFRFFFILGKEVEDNIVIWYIPKKNNYVIYNEIENNYSLYSEKLEIDPKIPWNKNCIYFCLRFKFKEEYKIIKKITRLCKNTEERNEIRLDLYKLFGITSDMILGNDIVLDDNLIIKELNEEIKKR